MNKLSNQHTNSYLKRVALTLCVLIFTGLSFVSLATAEQPVPGHYSWPVAEEYKDEIETFLRETDFSNCDVKSVGFSFGLGSALLSFFQKDGDCIAHVYTEIEGGERTHLCTIEEITAVDWTSESALNGFPVFPVCRALSKIHTYWLTEFNVDELESSYADLDFSNCNVTRLMLHYQQGSVLVNTEFSLDMNRELNCVLDVSTTDVNGKQFLEFCTTDEFRLLNWFRDANDKVLQVPPLGRRCQALYEDVTFQVAQDNAAIINDEIRNELYGAQIAGRHSDIRLNYADGNDVLLHVSFRNIGPGMIAYYTVETPLFEKNRSSELQVIACQEQDLGAINWAYDASGMLRTTAPQLSADCKIVMGKPEPDEQNLLFMLLNTLLFIVSFFI